MLMTKNLTVVLRFNALHNNHRFAEAMKDLPVEYEVPKPMMFFGKDISIQTSLDRWEASLATNTHTDYDEKVS